MKKVEPNKEVFFLAKFPTFQQQAALPNMANFVIMAVVRVPF